MAYAPEFTDLRQEIRRNTAGVLVHWPKIDGTGNVTASPTAGDCTVEIRSPDGVSISGPDDITPTTVADVGSRFDIPIPACNLLAEDYLAVLTWKVPGGAAYVEAIYFDVVTETFGPSPVSLASLQSLQPDLVDRIKRQADRLHQTPTQRASVLGHLARVELSELLRGVIVEDVTRISSLLPPTVSVSARDAYLRPRLIKDKARLASVETKLAVAIAYAADMRAGADQDDGADAVAMMARDWRERAMASFRSIGPLKYDIDENLTVDTEIKDVGRFVRQRRMQT